MHRRFDYFGRTHPLQARLAPSPPALIFSHRFLPLFSPLPLPFSICTPSSTLFPHVPSSSRVENRRSSRRRRRALPPAPLPPLHLTPPRSASCWPPPPFPSWGAGGVTAGRPRQTLTPLLPRGGQVASRLGHPPLPQFLIPSTRIAPRASFFFRF